MTTISGTIETYDLVGRAENISDIITTISPTTTPFQSSIGDESIVQIVHQWQEDSLIAVQSGGLVEGANAPVATAQPTVMRSNTTQIFGKTASASRTADVVKKYGRGKELAYQMMLRSKELKRNREYAFVGTAQVQVLGSDAVARVMASYQAQISSGTTNTLGSPTTLTETHVVTGLQTLFVNGADPDTVMVKPADGPRIALWATTPRVKYITNDDKKIVNAVDVYESPFGTVKVQLNRFLRGANAGDSQSDCLIFERDMWKVLTLRPWTRITLAVTGDATQVEMVGEFSLKHRNYSASYLISNLTPLT